LRIAAIDLFMKSLRFLASLLLGLMASCGTCQQFAFAQAPAPTPVPAPVWVKVAVEPDTVSTSSTVTWRYGVASGTTSDGVDCSIAPGCWSAPIASTIANVSISNPGGSFMRPDPANGLVKELDILEIVTMQSVTVNGVLKIVPANPLLTPFVPTVYSPTYRAGTFYPVRVSNVSVITGNPAQTVLQTFNIPPYMFMAGVLQNFNFTFSVGVVPFSCTYGGLMVSSAGVGTISMNCTPIQKTP
jgi:hypothetical protein